MKEAEIPDKNIFMMCSALNQNALTELPASYSIRNCRTDELNIWKMMPFDDLDLAKEYEQFMSDYFNTTYADKEQLFFAKTLFVCDRQDKPIATCLSWKAYDEFSTIQWFKVLKEYEGQGIGRALLSIVMQEIALHDYPVYLHTQPSSFRAIKLYSDFGFSLLSGDNFGIRNNDLDECLPILEKFMPTEYFQKLRIVIAPKEFEDATNKYDTNQF
ncbi:GNAT family N-acetyltransferase [Chamaesiphon minutus]|uniref:Acetyltransferase n=1 Tax=Chamaesiphon minutus (strain ATCC 27169 / PCC 6605) TaxID=1173020 RepID=K9ULC5_CHAP6|nr:GNAT family N-acetyltransferase [Chamaesiphon minutus]AFY95241.1 acetyltransferase [Chamaesiphon minutus PCC 6605]